MAKPQDLDTAYGLEARRVTARARVEQLTSLGDGEATPRFETDDGNASLTDLQRAALRWLSSFD